MKKMSLVFLNSKPWLQWIRNRKQTGYRLIPSSLCCCRCIIMVFVLSIILLEVGSYLVFFTFYTFMASTEYMPSHIVSLLPFFHFVGPVLSAVPSLLSSWLLLSPYPLLIALLSSCLPFPSFLHLPQPLSAHAALDAWLCLSALLSPFVLFFFNCSCLSVYHTVSV